jgi:hexosaminidase
MTADHYALIPQPAELHYSGQIHTFRAPVVLSATSAGEEVTALIAWARVEVQRCGIERRETNAEGAGSRIAFELAADAQLVAEGAYRLSVRGDGIQIRSGTVAGLGYGVQTLLQMISGRTHGDGITLPGVEITDYPRFTWRGMHLDVSRHFVPVAFVRKYIDLLARHKMNRFHWHLTDDQGWRIEIRKYPRLTEIGAWRRGPDGKPYGGYYTQDEIREVVAYAQARQVMVIPEIEMPGHASAALAAYPEYSCTGGPFEVETAWGIFDDVYCAGKDETFRFLGDILSEVAALFPGPYIHIGGDECPKARWRSHAACQSRMKAERLVDEDALQAYFVNRIAKHLSSLGKTLIGWDEILDGGAPAGATVMAWRHVDKGVEAARLGHDVVMTPMPYCYFDHYQGVANEPKAIGGFTPLRSVYNFEPIPPDFPPNLVRHVLGAQGNVWTEYMAGTEHVEYMVFPRLCALAERLWSPSGAQPYSEFLDRLAPHLKRLDALGVAYRRLEI